MAMTTARDTEVMADTEDTTTARATAAATITHRATVVATTTARATEAVTITHRDMAARVATAVRFIRNACISGSNPLALFLFGVVNSPPGAVMFI